MNQNATLGKYGEDCAEKYLKDRGYAILDRNWRCALGEIDLIARDRNNLVFVEVKTRSGRGFGHPFEAITEAKVARMRKLVAQWCSVQQLNVAQVRLDAIAVLVSGGKVAIEHLKQVF